MVFGIALHVNYAELNLSGGKQAFGDGQQTGKIILNDDENTAQTALEQAAQDELPVFQILAAGLCKAGQHSFFAIPTQPNDQVNTSGFEAIALADLDVLTVEKQSQQVRIQRTSVAQL